MIPLEETSDEDFERHAFAILRRELGWMVWLASSAFIDPALETTLGSPPLAGRRQDPGGHGPK